MLHCCFSKGLCGLVVQCSVLTALYMKKKSVEGCCENAHSDIFIAIYSFYYNFLSLAFGINNKYLYFGVIKLYFWPGEDIETWKLGYIVYIVLFYFKWWRKNVSHEFASLRCFWRYDYDFFFCGRHKKILWRVWLPCAWFLWTKNTKEFLKKAFFVFYIQV